MKRVATVLIVLAVLGGCSKSKSKSDATSSSSTSGSVTSTASGETILPGATTTIGKNTTPAKLTTPDAAATHLFLAWQKNNRIEAAQYASDAAVNSLFAHPYTGPEPTFQGCEHQVDHYNCGYQTPGSAIIFRVEGSASAGYRVGSVDLIAD